MPIKNIMDFRRHDFRNIFLDKTTEPFWQIILLHKRGIIIFLIFHVGFQHIKQWKL